MKTTTPMSLYHQTRSFVLTERPVAAEITHCVIKSYQILSLPKHLQSVASQKATSTAVLYIRPAINPKFRKGMFRFSFTITLDDRGCSAVELLRRTER